MGLKYLSGLDDLEELSVNDTAITDAGLKEPQVQVVLSKVSLRGCKKVTKAGVAALKMLNPKMVIEGP